MEELLDMTKNRIIETTTMQKFVKRLAERLNDKSFSLASLKNFRQFYPYYPQLAEPVVRYLFAKSAKSQSVISLLQFSGNLDVIKSQSPIIQIPLQESDTVLVDDFVTMTMEGGVLPTDVEAIKGGNKTSVVMTIKRPATHVQPSNLIGSIRSTPSGATIQQPVNPCHARDDGEYQSSDGGHQSSEPNEERPELEMFVENGESSTQESQDPYEAVKDAINNAEILTYEVKTVAVNKNYVRSLFEMARLGDMTGMDENAAAVDKVKDDIARLIHNYISELKAKGEYEALVDKALEFQLNTKSVELYKSGSSYDVQQGPDLFSRTDAGLQRQYFNADILLCGEGVGQRYADNYETDDYASMYDVILYVADSHQTDIRMDYAKEEFNRLADLYRPKSKNISEKDRQRYNSLVTMGSTISKHLFHLPETINVDLDNEGETCTDHLFVNDDGTATFNLKGWEPITLAEERKNPHFVCWLRNQDRKSWTLCIPYDYGGETHRMFPDFLIARKNEYGNYEYG
jgi:type III restriction enzyme